MSRQNITGLPDHVLANIVAAIGIFISLLLLYLVLRLLSKVISGLVSKARPSISSVGSGVVWASLVITAFLVPTPFAQLAKFIVALFIFLAVDLPSRVIQLAANVQEACIYSDSDRQCSQAVLGWANTVWLQGIKSLFSQITVGSDFLLALLSFTLCVGAAWSARQAMPAIERNKGSDSVILKSSALLVSLSFALYLCITSILAIPIFSDRINNVDEIKRQLTEATKPLDLYKKEVDSVTIGDLKEIDFRQIRAEINSLQLQKTETNPVTANADSMGAATYKNVDFEVDSYKRILLWSVDELEEKATGWTRAYTELRRAAGGLPGRAERYGQRVTDHFVRNNTGRVGGNLSQQHAAKLVASYRLWISNYYDGLEACRAALTALQDKIQAQHSILKQQLITLATVTSLPNIESTLEQVGDHQLSRNEFAETCSRSAAFEEMDLPSRQDPSEVLGVFGKAAGWLLTTESRDLALIVGLIGFGFFGALAASFIREFAATPGNALPPADWMVPALVRGMAAAILVFLVVVGGIAIFTQASTEPTPNPYAVFFACFIAAVFSEDVWEWARRRQLQGFRVADSSVDHGAKTGTGTQSSVDPKASGTAANISAVGEANVKPVNTQSNQVNVATMPSSFSGKPPY